MTTSPNSSSPASLTLADFDAANIQQILRDHQDMNCQGLSKVFWDAKNSAVDGAARALELLAGLCSMRLVPEESTVIYRPMLEWSNGNTSMTPGHISSDAVETLAQVAESIANVSLRARIADLVWQLDRSRGSKFATMAISAFRQLPLNPENWHGEVKAGWHRALQLAKQIRANEEIAAVEAALLGAFFTAAGADGNQALHFLRPLFAERRSGGRAQEVAGQLAEIGRQRLAIKHAFPAQTHFEAAAEWYVWARDRDHQALMLSLAAEAITLQAEQANGAVVQHHWLTKAIEAYRRVPGRYRAQLGVDEAIQSIRHRRHDAGHAMLGEMVMMPGHRIDVSAQIASAVNHVKGRSAREALYAFCGLDSPPDVAALKEAAETIMKATPLRTLLGMNIVAGDGRQVENIGPDNGWDAQVNSQAHAMFLEHAGRTALARLLPARDQLRFEHDYRLDDFIALSEGSPIIPADRARMVGQGLHAGYCGAMVQAMHILMPQFEHVVRHTLRGGGALTTQHDQEGLDMEVALASLIDRPEMTKEFGDGMTLAISALLCDRSGPNLRNNIAHGLADEDACESAHALYAWWLILQLVTKTFSAAMPVPGAPAVNAAAQQDVDGGRPQ